MDIWVQQSFLKDVGFWVVFDNCLDFLSLVQFILFSFSVIIPDKIAGWMLCWLIACLSLDLLFMEMSTCVCESPHEQANLRGSSCLKSLDLFQEAVFLCCEVFTDAGSILQGGETGRGFAAQQFPTNLLNLMCSSQTVQRTNDEYEGHQGAAGVTDSV